MHEVDSTEGALQHNTSKVNVQEVQEIAEVIKKETPDC